MSEFPTYTPRANEYVADRADFITKTYLHLLGAILGFMGIEAFLFATGLAQTLGEKIIGFGSVGWLAVLGGFMVVGWLATHTAHTAASKGAQYAALVGYVAVEAILFLPLLYIANEYYPGAIKGAAIATAVGFTALTAIVLLTRKDFSFLRTVLWWGGCIALVLIVASVIFQFNLGVIFSVAMIAFAGASILYDTSNVLHHYPEDRYVGASLQLFASIALMFWYVLRLFMSKD